MNKPIFKKTNRKKIKKGDLFSFIMNENYHYGRILSNTFLGLIAIIYKSTTKDLLIDFNESSFYEPPIILDGFSLFQLKNEGDWGIISTNENYEIPSELLRFVLGNTNDNSSKIITGIDMNGNKIQINLSDTTLKIADNVIYGDYDVAEYLKTN